MKKNILDKLNIATVIIIIIIALAGSTIKFNKETKENKKQEIISLLDANLQHVVFHNNRVEIEKNNLSKLPRDAQFYNSLEETIKYHESQADSCLNLVNNYSRELNNLQK